MDDFSTIIHAMARIALAALCYPQDVILSSLKTVLAMYSKEFPKDKVKPLNVILLLKSPSLCEGRVRGCVFI